MQRTAAEGRGQVRYGPPAPQPGLPVLSELISVLGAAAGHSSPQPPGGGLSLREAACRYWGRRGLAASPENVAAGPGAPALLLALLGAYGGDVMLPRPCPAWWTPQVRLLGRRAYHVPTPAECGGVPDPYALLETVRRVRAEGGDPRVLLLSVADDPTATVPPPELVREACEAAESAGLFVVSDESWRDTVHRPHDDLVLSPAEMLPEQAAVLVDLSGALLPAGWPAAVVRFPGTPRGARLRAGTLDVLTATGAVVAGPVAGAAAHALDEPDAVAARAYAAARLHGLVAVEAHRDPRGGSPGPAPAGRTAPVRRPHPAARRTRPARCRRRHGAGGLARRPARRTHPRRTAVRGRTGRTAGQVVHRAAAGRHARGAACRAHRPRSARTAARAELPGPPRIGPGRTGLTAGLA